MRIAKPSISVAIINSFISFSFFYILYVPLSHAQIQHSACTNMGGLCKTACAANENSHGSCMIGHATTVTVCCVGSTTAPPPGGGGNTVPDTNCPADSTYVAITDSCVSVSDFNNFLFNLLILAGVLVAIYRATAGFFMFMTAEGNPEKLQGGREALTQAMVGLLIVVAGWVLIRAFEQFLPSTWNIFLTG